MTVGIISWFFDIDYWDFNRFRVVFRDDEVSLDLIDSEDFNQERLNEHIAAVDQKLIAMRKAHFQSLADDVPAAVASSSQYLDILSEMESSITKIKNIAKIVQEDRF